jgi:hypothetical protein
MLSVLRKALSAFWSELNTPGAFQNDPYGALTNQAGHICIGATLTATYALIFCGIVGEMPYWLPTWALITFGYLVAVEWTAQGWKGADSVFDGGFIGLGAAAPLVALKEVSFEPKVMLEPQIKEGLALLALIVVALAVYVLPRVIRWWQAKQERAR